MPRRTFQTKPGTRDLFFKNAFSRPPRRGVVGRPHFSTSPPSFFLSLPLLIIPSSMDSLRVPVRAVFYFRRDKHARRRRNVGSAVHFVRGLVLPPRSRHRERSFPRRVRFGVGGGELRPNVYSVSRPSAQSRAIRPLAHVTRSRFTPLVRHSSATPARRDPRAFARAFAHLAPAALRSAAEARRVANAPARDALADQRWEQHRRRQRAAEDAATLADLMDLARE